MKFKNGDCNTSKYTHRTITNNKCFSNIFKIIINNNKSSNIFKIQKN